VTLEASFQGLRLQLQRLRETVAALHVALVVDRPTQNDVALIDGLGDAVDDLLALLKEALAAAQDACQAAEYPRDWHRAIWALTNGQEHFNRFLQQMTAGLMAYERIAELLTLGVERGGEWHGWAHSVKDAIERCREPADRVTQALLGCWQEMADRAELHAVSIRTVSIGQQIGSLEDVHEKGRDPT
jgi:hypothetical protein